MRFALPRLGPWAPGLGLAAARLLAEHGARVLIVDDVPDNLALLHDALDEAGYTVLVATHGEQALQRVGLAPVLFGNPLQMPVALQNCHGLIGGPAVDDDMLETGIVLVKDTGNGLFDIPALIVRRGDHGEFQHGGR